LALIVHTGVSKCSPTNPDLAVSPPQVKPRKGKHSAPRLRCVAVFGRRSLHTHLSDAVGGYARGAPAPPLA